MVGFLIEALVFLYASVSIITILGYVPTIKDLINKKMSANILSYAVWTATSFVTFLYSIFVLPDFWFQAVSLMGLLGCAAILILAVFLKYKKN